MALTDFFMIFCWWTMFSGWIGSLFIIVQLQGNSYVCLHSPLSQPGVYVPSGHFYKLQNLNITLCYFALTHQTRDIEPLLVQCWPTVYDVGPTLKQQWLGVSCLLGNCMSGMLFSERIEKTVSIEASTVEIEERGVKLRLTVVDTPGFADGINSVDWYDNYNLSLSVYSLRILYN